QAAQCSGCKACNVLGSEGTCTNVPTGEDPHGACAAVVCANKCNGGGACRPAAASTVCSTATCVNVESSGFGRVGYTTGIKYCSGSSTGTCDGATSGCPGGYICSAPSTCKASCTVDADCIFNTYCSGGRCVSSLARNSTGCTRNAQCQFKNVCV